MPKSGRKLELWRDRRVSPKCRPRRPRSSRSSSRKPADFRLIGKDVMRVELPGKVNGSARYGIDVQVPDMLYGAVLRAPVEGSVPDRIDDSNVKSISGVVKVIRLALRRWRGRRNAVGGIRSPPGAHPERDLDADRHRLGLRQRQGPGTLRCRRQKPRQRRDGVEQARRPARRDAEGGGQHGGRVPLRLRLSRADGAAERRGIGVTVGRRRRDMGRNAEPEHRPARRRPSSSALRATRSSSTTC